MEVLIRQEEEKDRRITEELVRECFWNLYKPGCDEHLSAHNLRKSKDFLPELTFVMEAEGEIIGSIFYSLAHVISKDGTTHDLISFGPICIKPDLQRKGLGRQLIEHSFEKAKELGYKGVVIAGFYDYYSKYGFESAKKYKVHMPDGKYYKGIMILPLEKGAMKGISGELHFAIPMEEDESAVEAFDATFGYKEKKVLDCQKKFEGAVIEFDEEEYDDVGKGLAFGLCFGVTFGIIFDNIALGICLGMCFGLIYDKKQK